MNLGELRIHLIFYKWFLIFCCTQITVVGINYKKDFSRVFLYLFDAVNKLTKENRKIDNIDCNNALL